MAKRASQYPISDEMVVWAESLAGMLTKIETRYEGTSEMIECPEWDSGRTDYFVSLLGDVREHVNRIHAELVEHVSQKPS